MVPYLVILILLPVSLTEASVLDNGDGTVRQPESMKMWVADGQFIVESGLTNSPIMPRFEALALVEAINAGTVWNFGYSNWRLPTDGEYAQLYNLQRTSNSFENQVLFQNWFKYKNKSNPTGTRTTSTRNRRTTSDEVFIWPVRTQTIPEGFADVVVFATNSIHISRGTELKGNVVVNEASSGPTLNPGYELALDRGVVISGNIKADSIDKDKGASVSGTVSCNDGAGVSCTGLSLPVFPPADILALFKEAQVRAGAEDVQVPKNGTVSLAEGDFADVKVEAGGEIIFNGGVYNIGSLMAGKLTRLVFMAPTELRIAGMFSQGRDSFMGPGPGSTASPSTIILFVGGENLVPDDPNSVPAAATVNQNSVVEANIWANNGTVWINKTASFVGAVYGRDVKVDQASQVIPTERANFFNLPPTADPQDVFTAGDANLLITLTGSDPEGEPLTFSIQSLPSNGSLFDGATPISSVPYDLPGSEVTFDPATDADLEDNFVFRVTDPNGGFGEATVWVNPIDDTTKPGPTDTVIAQGASYEMVEDSVLDITLNAVVDAVNPSLAGDLSFQIILGPLNGTLKDSDGFDVMSVPADLPTNQVSYTPGSGFVGDDSFQFKACALIEGTEECDSAQVNIKVNAYTPPDPPVAENYQVTTPVSTNFSINLVDGSGQGGTVPGDGRSDLVATSDYPPNGYIELSAPMDLYSPMAELSIILDSGWSATQTKPPAFFWSGTPPVIADDSYSFTVADGQQVCVSVTDDFDKGDQFRIYDNGQAIGTTSLVEVDDASPETDPGVGPAAAYLDPSWSSGSFTVGEGEHLIEIEVIPPNSFSIGRGYIRVDSGPCRPNLTVTAFSAPQQAALDQSIGDQIQTTVTNTGTSVIGAGTAASIGFYVSEDPTITTSDRLLQGGRENLSTQAPNGLGVGESVEISLFSGADISSTFPDNNPLTGDVYIGVVVDESNAIAESDETDNTASQLITVETPDLVIASFTHDPANPDNENFIEFTAVVKNDGPTAAGASTACLDIGGEACGQEGTLFAVPGLGPGETFDVVRTAGLSAGSYQNTAVADYYDDVIESDENNNSAVDTFTVIEATETARFVAVIVKLPEVGKLLDSSGNEITVEGVQLLDTIVTYQPPQDYTGPATFSYQIIDNLTGLSSGIGLVTITVGVLEGDCLTNPEFCDDGRP
jgi:hypothetical protein